VVTIELEEANRKKEEVNRKLGEANRKLRDLARHDRLTELLNRGEIVAIFHREVERMQSDEFPISAIMIDLDDFKHINDNFGHDMGDEVLRTVAKIMLENVRGGDYAGRFGGEEFLIVLPGAPLRIAEIVAERIRAKIESVLILPGGKHVSGSFGVCEVKTGEKSEVFYKRIDNALYQAKHKGKNCVVAG
jgi:diguanylate cyclase (GGDEF)-like protein